MNKKNLSIGVLLINVGTPNFPTKKSVRKYLKEFLSDKRILDIPFIFRLLLLYLIILPFRSQKSANLYKKIWTKEGSPLLVWSEKCAHKLSLALGEGFNVKLGMCYGSPSIPDKIKEFKKENVEKLVVVPLFPQYAASTTGSVIEGVSKELIQYWHIPAYGFVPPFFHHPDFISAHKNRIMEIKESFHPDFFLFSYHGLPIRHLNKSAEGIENSSCMKSENCCQTFNHTNSFCYRAQCFETTRLIAQACEIGENKLNAFQSRFGKTEWISPDIINVLPALRSKGIKRIAVVCPGFVADCLETLEEIGIRLKESWCEIGGEDLVLVPSLNDNDLWISCLKDIILKMPISTTI